MPPFEEESEGEVLMAEVTLWFDDEEDCERVDETRGFRGGRGFR